MAPCPVCGSESDKLLFVKDDLPYHRCGCGFIFTGGNSSAAVTGGKQYAEEYYTPWEISLGAQSPAHISKTATFKRWLNRIGKHTNGRGSLLDIGCGTGVFLEVAADQGWDVYGIEISAWAAAQAARLFGPRIHTGPLADAVFKNRRFDLVTGFDVVEHIAKPAPFFVEIARILRPGGVLGLSTANTASFSRMLFKKSWPQFKPEHCSYFSSGVIKRTLLRSGFSVIEIGPARKRVNLAYATSYFNTYPSVVAGFLFRWINRMAPFSLRMYPVAMPTGEMMVIARRLE